MMSLSHTTFFDKLDQLRPQHISYAETELPRMLTKLEPAIEEVPYLSWLSLLAKKAGHSCAPLPKLQQQAWELFKSYWSEELKELLTEIEAHLLEFATKYNQGTASYTANKSFLVDNGWLYSGKQTKEETELAEAFKKRFEANAQQLEALKQNANTLNQLLEAACGQPDKAYYLDSSQKEAVVRSLISNAAIITGGPGTGKTTTARRVLEAFLLLWDQQDLPRIFMAAPTGKAASRLTESMSAQHTPQIGDLQAKLPALPPEAKTLHRLLGMDSAGNAKYNNEQPLNADLILVDEASMIDQYLMNQLLQALQPSCRLILIGDRHQLPSVEAGAVFAQLYPPQLALEQLHLNMNRLEELDNTTSSPKAWAVAQLQRGHRSAQQSGIASLAQRMQADEKLPTDLQYPDIHMRTEDHKQLQKTLSEFVKEEKEAFKHIKSVEQAFAQIKKTQFLTITSKFKRGADGINQYINQQWSAYSGYEPGFRIIIRQNDYQNELFNGEIGIYLEGIDQQGRFYFEGKEAGSPPRSFLPEQLNRFELAFALTVHKSQGSEYEHVHLIAPTQETIHPLFSKELLYTAITRSKKEFSYWGKTDHFIVASSHPQTRFSQLRQKIWSD